MFENEIFKNFILEGLKSLCNTNATNTHALQSKREAASINAPENDQYNRDQKALLTRRQAKTTTKDWNPKQRLAMLHSFNSVIQNLKIEIRQVECWEQQCEGENAMTRLKGFSHF